MKSVCDLTLGCKLLGNKNVREYFTIIDETSDEDLIIGDYREITVEIGYKGEVIRHYTWLPPEMIRYSCYSMIADRIDDDNL